MLLASSENEAVIASLQSERHLPAVSRHPQYNPWAEVKQLLRFWDPLATKSSLRLQEPPASRPAQLPRAPRAAAPGGWLRESALSMSLREGRLLSGSGGTWHPVWWGGGAWHPVWWGWGRLAPSVVGVGRLAALEAASVGPRSLGPAAEQSRPSEERTVGHGRGSSCDSAPVLTGASVPAPPRG